MKSILLNNKFLFLFLLCVFILPSNAIAAASADCIAVLAPGWVGQVKNVVKVFQLVSYVSGIFFGFKAILKFKEHNETKGQVKIAIPFFHIVASAALLALPTLIEIATDALVGTDADTGVSSDGNISSYSCGSSSGTPSSIGEMFANFQPSALSLYEMAYYVAWAIGVYLMISAVFKLAALGSSPQASPKAPLINFTVGAFMIAMSSTLKIVGESIKTGGWDSARNPGSILINSPKSLGGSVDVIQQGIFAFLMFLGIVAVIRGWLLLNQMALGKQDVLGRGLTHIFGGVVLINLHMFGPMVAKSFGWG